MIVASGDSAWWCPKQTPPWRLPRGGKVGRKIAGMLWNKRNTIDGLCHLSLDFPGENYPSSSLGKITHGETGRIPDSPVIFHSWSLGRGQSTLPTLPWRTLEKPRLRPRQDAHHWAGIHRFAARRDTTSAPWKGIAADPWNGCLTFNVYIHKYIYTYLYITRYIYIYTHMYIWLHMCILNILNCMHYKSLPNNHCKSWKSNGLESSKTWVIESSWIIGPSIHGREVAIEAYPSWKGGERTPTNHCHLPEKWRAEAAHFPNTPGRCDPVKHFWKRTCGTTRNRHVHFRHMIFWTFLADIFHGFQ